MKAPVRATIRHDRGTWRAVLGERRVERACVELGMAPGFRHGADIGQLPDAVPIGSRRQAGEEEIMAKLTAARRIVSRHNRLDERVRELYGLATRDELTGLFNRRFFFAEAERRLREGASVGLHVVITADRSGMVGFRCAADAG